ncbi:ATP-dependent nuclease [Brevibacterium sp. CFH 10365]|uniref:ATP-dependent nuclease n=1 Tax=Brevibacterium sp. CFH 10365 TaxID=2585207 RepID=UPI0012665B07|nr:AAA family ATPase [Brevibacterium sp. CFH 10365]
MDRTWRDELKAAFGEGQPGIADGIAERFTVGIGNVKMKEGSSFTPSRTGVTVVVGGNNSGKSTLLREIRQELTGKGYASPGNITQSVQSLETLVEGKPEDMIAWVAGRADIVHGNYGLVIRLREGDEVDPIRLMRSFHSGDHPLGVIESKVIYASDGENRFRAIHEAEQYDPHRSRPSEPIQYLQGDVELREDISRIFQKVFGHPLELDPLNYRLNLRIGRIDMETPKLDYIPPEYRDAMAALPPVSMQGDGVKSFMGQVLPVVTGAFPIVLLDEPEAFLHPPQARALGEYLGSFAGTTGAQVIAATHDKNFLAGLLETDTDVSVVRLTRESGCPRVSQLDSSQLRDVWNDPIVKYSNVLDGLFHQVVVLAEAETDCGFFRAVLDTIDANDCFPKSDILFIPTGGKSAMSKVARTLRAASVPVIAVADIDILNDKAIISSLVESLGSNWSDSMDKELGIVSADVNSRSLNSVTVGDVLKMLGEAFGDRSADDFDAGVKKEFNRYLRTKDSYWKTVKMSGINAFQGEQYSRVRRLIDSLLEAGVVVVQAGELEQLAPAVEERKGPRWLSSALEQGAHKEEPAQRHVARILEASKNALGRSTAQREVPADQPKANI